MDDIQNKSATPAPKPAVDHRPPNRLPLLLLLLSGVIFLWYLPVLLERIEYSRTRGEVQAIKEALPAMDLKALSKSFALVYRKIKPSVVHIDTQRPAEMRDRFGLGAMFGGNEAAVEEGEASGVIVDPAGYLVTSYHVVEDASDITVKLDDGRSFPAAVVGRDPAVDLAVLKINATGLTAAEWGDSDKLEVGEMVWAIGSPYGLDQTITSGIISAKGRRELGVFQDFLQTDVALNPGNSGGPLVDVNGDIVGINSAIFGRAYQGISFAIPSNLAREVYETLREKGEIVRGDFGVTLVPLTLQIAHQVELPDGVTAGAVVAYVRPGLPAQAAGVRRGDVIVQWNGQAVKGDGELQALIARTPIGAKVAVVLYRYGKEMTIETTVTQRRPGE